MKILCTTFVTCLMVASFAHAQSVNTSSVFPPSTYPAPATDDVTQDDTAPLN